MMMMMGNEPKLYHNDDNTVMIKSSITRATMHNNWCNGYTVKQTVPITIFMRKKIQSLKKNKDKQKNSKSFCVVSITQHTELIRTSYKQI